MNFMNWRSQTGRTTEFFGTLAKIGGWRVDRPAWRDSQGLEDRALLKNVKEFGDLPSSSHSSSRISRRFYLTAYPVLLNSWP